MQRYTRLVLIILAGAFAGFIGFNAVIDPYDTGTGPEIAGINAEKTRGHEDGRRVQVGHQLGQTGARSAITGSSRTVDGFPMTVDNWPGGLYNAGIRGSNAFELAHLAAIAGQQADLRCFVIGLDTDEFTSGDKYKPAFPISRLADGNRWLATARVTLSPNTFARAAQTLAENITGNPPEPPFREVYEPGVQYQRFVNTPLPRLTYYRTMRVSSERMDFLFSTLEALAREGVQVIGYIHPVHAWNEESLFAAGREQVYFDFRVEMARRFEALAEQAGAEPVAPCVPGGAGVLWDFSGFQTPSTSPLPGPEQTVSHDIYHEPAHYLPSLGLSMLARMRSGPSEREDAFGTLLSGADPRDSEAAILARREAYLETQDGQRLTDMLAPAIASAAAPRGFQSVPISHAERRTLHRLNRQIAARQQREQALSD
ncbi:hypothetical protein [Glycocaulis sp.]